MSIKQQVYKMKEISPVMASTLLGVRNQALLKIAETLQAHSEQIFTANKKDLDAANANNVAQSVQNRLKFDESKLNDCIEGLRQTANLPDPIGQTLLKRQLDDNLILQKISCPIGVVGVIFEARPDALIQISSLCIKSGNCAVLKGGKETHNTNKILFELIYKAALAAGLPEGCFIQAEQHSEIDELLALDEYVDLLIPRGSNSFVRYIMDNTKIPVMGHSSGICHIFVDEHADQNMAIPVIIDSKTQYPAACNALETLLVARSIASEVLPKIARALEQKSVKIHGSGEVAKIINCIPKTDNDYSIEYSDLELTVKLVDDVKEAVLHINKYGSHHTDCIITESDANASYFMQMVDSAGVYRNCSTRFADGFRYGFGAEVGISTGKIHARGPVGLDGLCTYKYELTGNGQIVEDYTTKKCEFKFIDLS